jgi:hydroxymethylpyrimidine/phosphomethylpyrimidine kinase
MTPIALTIAGSDTGGGAGIQADLKTFSALGVYGATVITALTAQNTLGVQGIFDVPASFVSAQMASVFDDIRIDAVKIGMLSQPDTIDAVASALKDRRLRTIVLDPVMVATSGDRLISPGAVERLREALLPLARIVTPNLPEAAALLDEPVASTREAIEAQGRRILALGCGAVLIKGGHGGGAESEDNLVSAEGTERFTASRIPTRHTHGTGCTLSAAIAARLAAGRDLVAAVAEAKRYLTAALASAEALGVGAGSGPVHHFHGWWEPADP